MGTLTGHVTKLQGKARQSEQVFAARLFGR